MDSSVATGEKIAMQIINNTMKIYTPTYSNLDLARIINKRMAEVCGCEPLSDKDLNTAIRYCKESAIVFDGKNLGWGSTHNYLRGSVYTLVTVDKLMTMPKAIVIEGGDLRIAVTKDGITVSNSIEPVAFVPHSVVTKLQEAIEKVKE